MKTTANIATFPSRENELKKMLASIRGQFDITRLYFNNISKRPDWIPDWVDVYCGDNNNGDLTDNGKFFFLSPGEDEYYFTLDDDIAYPLTYATDMVEAIDLHNCIVTHHGRRLDGLGLDYYRGHKVFMCLRAVDRTQVIDVAGTGVTAFDTRYFNPHNLWCSGNQKMSDVIFSHEAAQQSKIIKVLQHSDKYFTYLFPNENNTIHQQSFRNCSVQSRLADKIYRIKHYLK